MAGSAEPTCTQLLRRSRQNLPLLISGKRKLHSHRCKASGQSQHGDQALSGVLTQPAKGGLPSCALTPGMALLEADGRGVPVSSVPETTDSKAVMATGPAVPRPAKRSLIGHGSYAETLCIGEILRRETVGGILLVTAAAAVIVWANSPAAGSYFALRDLTVGYENNVGRLSFQDEWLSGSIGSTDRSPYFPAQFGRGACGPTEAYAGYHVRPSRRPLFPCREDHPLAG
jgi:Na+/H+ antiporter 1